MRGAAAAAAGTGARGGGDAGGAEAMAGETGGDDGSGGMITKIKAARIAMQSGCRMVILDGRDLHPLRRLADGERATWFLPQGQPQTSRKRWIAGSLNPVGTIVVDAGAAAALARGKSLLPAGVTGADGKFQRGDPVVVKRTDGIEIARGLVNYNFRDLEKIMGMRTGAVRKIFGDNFYNEVIHRDDLALL